MVEMLLALQLQLLKGDIIYGGNVTKWKKLKFCFITSSSDVKKISFKQVLLQQNFNAALSNSSGLSKLLQMKLGFHHQICLPNPLNAFRAADYRLSRELVES